MPAAIAAKPVPTKQPTFTAYVTKYAFTDGILEVQAVQSASKPDRMITVYGPTLASYGQSFFGEGKDWHRTLGEAQARVETMRQAKMKALQKQLKRLQELDPAGMPAKVWP